MQRISHLFLLVVSVVALGVFSACTTTSTASCCGKDGKCCKGDHDHGHDHDHGDGHSH